MKKIIPDIDIDFPNAKQVFEKIPHIRASQIINNDLTPHQSGVYFNRLPIDDKTNVCSLDYKTIEDHGIFKIDFLSLTLYKDVKNEKHLNRLIDKEPLWEILEDEELVSELFHVKGHFDIVNKIKPKTVEELAVVIALIRPGKRHLLYKDLPYIMEHIWDKDDTKFSFKKSHAISYAMVIVVQMNLLMEQLST
ncbi:MAG: bacterial DNA polymerase III alpha [Caudoviricetes sp.]|nr:MAG: bacterial DNA polymerase III alpha [Caudoviricetes sp.]